jgi:hypothetical protein
MTSLWFATTISASRGLGAFRGAFRGPLLFCCSIGSAFGHIFAPMVGAIRPACGRHEA